MKKINSFIFGLVTLFTMSVVMVSCSADYSDGPMQAPQKKVEPADTTKTDPTPQPTDSTEWKNVVRKYYKVYEDANVTSTIIGQRNNGNLDSLVLRYKYEYALAKDTTIYLSAAPTSELGFSSAIENTSYSDYSHNEQGDSVCFINYAKPYYLSNGVNLSLTTQRVRGWHMMGGVPVMYSEPNQSVDRLTISSETTEFEKNDSIFGLRTNVCSVPLTLGGVQFTASATVKEIWFSRLKETPEPEHQVTISEHASFVAGSKCKVALNNWTDDFLFKGKTKAYTIVAKPDANGGRAIGYAVDEIELNRVVMNSQVNGTIYDATTSHHIPALITPDNKDKNGWFTEGFVDGRAINYDPTNAQALEEGIRNFVGKNTSVPTPFFISVSTSSQTWHEYTYVTITWSKYSKDTDMVTQTVTVKMPSK